MKIAVICDMHFGVRNDSALLLENQERFFREVFFPKIDELGIRVVLDLGDTFDRRKFVNFLTLMSAKRFFFDEMAKRGIEYHSIVGNHSVFYKNTNEVNSMDLLLGEYSNFKNYADGPVELEFGSTKLLFAPWITTSNEEISMRAFAESRASVLAGHLELQGFELTRGQVCTHGMDRRLLDGFSQVWSGHFHHPSRHANIEYLGAPYEMVWSDWNGVRGFHVFDTETAIIERVVNPNTLFRKLSYNDTDLEIDEIRDLDVSSIRGAFVKVLVSKKTNPYFFDLFVDRLQSAGPADLKILEESLFVDSSDSEDGEAVTEAKDTSQLIEEKVDVVCSKHPELDRIRILSELNSLYVEAVRV